MENLIINHNIENFGKFFKMICMGKKKLGKKVKKKNEWSFDWGGKFIFLVLFWGFLDF
jgi:hypothetical protein